MGENLRFTVSCSWPWKTFASSVPRFSQTNTFLSPVLQRPFEHGADLVVHSTTKYLNGHSDVVGGAVVAAPGQTALLQRIQSVNNLLGTSQSPHDAFLVLRGLKTLLLRMRAHEAGARAVAGYLAPEHRGYFDGIQKQMASWGLAGHLDYAGAPDRVRKLAFLQTLSVLSVPSPRPTQKGQFLLEAMASGVPVVQPRLGDAHVYGGQSRFMTPAVRAQLEQVTWPQAETLYATARNDAPPVDVTGKLRRLWS